MNILSESNINVINFLGGFQKYNKNVKYRFCKNIVKVDLIDRVLLYNSLTGAVVSLFNFEYNDLERDIPCDYLTFLYANYFLVREDFNEIEVTDLYRANNQSYISSNYLDSIKHATILTTTKCNANCTYCYEANIEEKHNMSIDTAKKVLTYLVNSYSYDSPLTIEWFGGEPLTNTDVIDYISAGLKSAGIQIIGNMITNGYLFDENLVEKAAHLWEIKNVQITLDGTEEVYNKTKRYVYLNDPNPFARVIRNIHLLQEFNISVTIRLNCGTHNKQTLLDLIDYLEKEFPNKNNISIYVWEIFSNGPRTIENAEKIFANLNEVDEAIAASNFDSPEYLCAGIKATHCLVDNNQGVIIGVDGDLCVCEHYVKDDFFSSVTTPWKKDLQVLKNWRNYTKLDSERCLECPIRPGCLKVSRCTDQYICTEPEQRYILNRTKRRMLKLHKDSIMAPITPISCCQN